jgi:hypothetical protein
LVCLLSQAKRQVTQKETQLSGHRDLGQCHKRQGRVTSDSHIEWSPFLSMEMPMKGAWELGMVRNVGKEKSSAVSRRAACNLQCSSLLGAGSATQIPNGHFTRSHNLSEGPQFQTCLSSRTLQRRAQHFFGYDCCPSLELEWPPKADVLKAWPPMC